MRCSASPKIASCFPLSPAAVQLRKPVAGEIPDTSVCLSRDSSFSRNKIFASEQAVRAASHAVLRPLLHGS